MPITSRSEYGMRAMIVLAEQSGEDLLSASELARREHIPLKYLEQLLAELKKAGLLISFPGARGGYRLARPPAEIPVGDVVRALDGPLSPMSCVAEGERAPCAFEAGCKLKPLWSILHGSVQKVLDHTTLEEVATSSALGGASLAGVRLSSVASPSPETPPPTEPSEVGEPSARCGLMYMI